MSIYAISMNIHSIDNVTLRIYHVVVKFNARDEWRGIL